MDGVLMKFNVLKDEKEEHFDERAKNNFYTFTEYIVIPMKYLYNMVTK